MSSGSFRRCGEFLRNFRVLINCGMPLQKGGGFRGVVLVCETRKTLIKGAVKWKRLGV